MKITKENFKSVILTITIVLMFNVVAYAAGGMEDTSTLDNFIKGFCVWIVKIGIIIAVYGGVDFAIAFHSNNPDQRINALRTIVAGLIVVAIGGSPQILGFV